jgi:hypothetical protein
MHTVALDKPRSGSGRQRGEAGAERAHLLVSQVRGDVRGVKRLHHVSVLSDDPADGAKRGRAAGVADDRDDLVTGGQILQEPEPFILLKKAAFLP